MVTVQVLRDPAEEVGEPDRPGIAARLMQSLTRSKPRDEPPALQFFRMDDTLYGECTGPVESGGWVQYSPEQKDQIAALGWAQAEGKDRGRGGYPQYCVYFPHEGGILSRPPEAKVRGDYRQLVDARRAAKLAVHTLRGPLGVSAPDGLTVQRRG